MNPASIEAILGDALGAVTRALEYAETAPTARYQAQSENGGVRVAVSGSRELLEIRIDPAAKRDLDNLTLGDLIAETVRAAERSADEAREALLDDLSIGGHRVSDVLRDPTALLPEPQRQAGHQP